MYMMYEAWRCDYAGRSVLIHAIIKVQINIMRTFLPLSPCNDIMTGGFIRED